MLDNLEKYYEMLEELEKNLKNQRSVSKTQWSRWLPAVDPSYLLK